MSVGSPYGFILPGAPKIVPPRLYVIDTSVALKWYIRESGTTEARRYKESGIDRHAPDLLRLEGAHALLKRTRSSNLSQHIPTRNAQLITEVLLESTLINYHSCGPLLERAMALAIEVGASVYDGLFLALAIEKKGRVVTADRPFHDKIVASSHSSFVRWFMDAP